MKFAKTLQQELCQEWIHQYLDYKMMKKVLKQEDPETADNFRELLESELSKIRSFMMGQQELIREAINPLEVAAYGSSNPPTECKIQVLTQDQVKLKGHCSQLVQNLENLRKYAALNQTAVLKITKKFNKRFNVSLELPLGLGACLKLPLSESDITSWLLSPALACLTLVRDSVGLPLANVERPMRQLNFWVEELRAGAQLTSMSMNDGLPLEDRTPMRLRLYGDEQEHWAVRNTFISCTERECTEPPRARSLPPRLGEGPCSDLLADEAAPHLLISAEVGETCVSQEASIHSEGSDKSDCCKSDNNSGVGCATDASSRNSRTSRTASSPESAKPRKQGRTGGGAEHRRGAEGPAGGGRRSAAPQQGAAPRRGGSPMRFTLRPSEEGRDCRPAPSRWWTTVMDMCPLSGFPISLLPYPPLKLQQQGVTLVDGVYLVLQVLATWKFEALGHPLGASEIVAIDAYMKRCKLGPFRLGRALELLSKGTPEAMKELEGMRRRARRRLDTVRQIQRGRMNQQRDDDTQRGRC